MPDETPAQTPPRRWNLAPIFLCIVITCGYFATLIFVLTQSIPPESERIIDMMIGTLTAVWLMSVSYFFGTTANSARKNEIIAKAGAVVDP